MKTKIFIVMALELFNVSIFYAQQIGTLKIGERAPSITTEQWLKGKPIFEFKKNHVYVVEFSQVDCPPCVKAIPHLTELAEEFRDRVEIISIYFGLDKNEFEKVNELIKNMGSKMEFSVAMDAPENTTKKAWGVIGVPTAFIVDQSGAIVWQGLPFNLNRSMLSEVLVGNFDGQMVDTQQHKVTNLVKCIMKTKQYQDYKAALKSIDSLISIYPENILLYHRKIEVLLVNDPIKGHEFIRHLLQSNAGDLISWSKVVHIVVSEPQYADYKLAEEVADRAIAEAKTEDAVASAWQQKVNIYLGKKCKSLEESLKTFEKVIQICESALSYCERNNINSYFSNQFKQKRLQIKYKVLLLRKSDQQAREFIRDLLNKNSEYIDWYSFLCDMLKLSEQLDHDLAVTLANKVLETSNVIGHVIGTYEKKAKIYTVRGDLKGAMRTYQQLLNFSRSSGEQSLINESEKKIIQFKKDYGL